MLRSSFRSLARPLLPGKGAHKQTILALLALLVSGCGGGGRAAPTTTTVAARIDGAGFRFEAPAGWEVKRTQRSVSAASGPDLVSVTVFPLARPYRPELRKQVAAELDRRIADLAGALRGELRSVGTARIAGRPARVYEIGVGDRVQRLLFIFKRRLEFQLLCRYGEGDGTEPCDRLAATFRLA